MTTAKFLSQAGRAATGDGWLPVSQTLRPENTLDEAGAGVSLDESLSRGTVTVDAAGKARLPWVSVRVRLLDPAGNPAAESTASAQTSAGSFNCRIALELAT